MQKHFDHIRDCGGISEYRLKTNGLTVLLAKDRTLPVVCINVTYRVGSRNEAVGYTGATHLLEHLMFKGSKRFHKGNGKPIDRLLISRGAELNATTWFDRTNYYEVVPRDMLGEVLAIEADRMQSAFIRESDRAAEMTVVRNEFERGENDPLEALDKAMWATAFQAHPYHHPTIGWRADVENVPIARLKAFYHTFYWPNNATVVLVGDIRAAEALALVTKHFGVLPRSPRDIPEVYTVEPEQQGERRVRVTRAGLTRIVGIAHKVPAALDEDSAALLLLMGVLIGGTASRLVRSLVDPGLVSAVLPLYQPLRDPGLFALYAILTPDTTHTDVESRILGEYERIKSGGVRTSELERAKTRFSAAAALARDGAHALASALNEMIAVGDWTLLVTLEGRMREVSTSDIAQVARHYLNADRATVGWFVPKIVEEEGGIMADLSVHEPLHESDVVAEA
ncbi:MAG: pitrilysin family protein [Patescibacteria group bacterium]|nr:pitrilysin family protein [Patescibacteria group bacterium]